MPCLCSIWLSTGSQAQFLRVSYVTVSDRLKSQAFYYAMLLYFLLKVTQINYISRNQLITLQNFCCQHLNLKGKTLLVVLKKIFVFSSVLKQNIIFSLFSALTEQAQKFKCLQNSCSGSWQGFHCCWWWSCRLQWFGGVADFVAGCSRFHHLFYWIQGKAKFAVPTYARFPSQQYPFHTIAGDFISCEEVCSQNQWGCPHVLE